MIYPVHWNGARYCQIAYTLGDVGVLRAGTPVSDMPTTPRLKGFAMPTASETFAQIMARRQKEAREREGQAKAWAAEVTEQLHNEASTFLKEFDEAEQRILGLVK